MQQRHSRSPSVATRRASNHVRSSQSNFPAALSNLRRFLSCGAGMTCPRCRLSWGWIRNILASAVKAAVKKPGKSLKNKKHTYLHIWHMYAPMGPAWFFSSFVAAASWRFSTLRWPFSSTILSAAGAGNATAATASADMSQCSVTNLSVWSHWSQFRPSIVRPQKQDRCKYTKPRSPCRTLEVYIYYTLPKTKIAPAGGLPKRKLIFQLQYFRCYVSFKEGIIHFMISDGTSCDLPDRKPTGAGSISGNFHCHARTVPFRWELADKNQWISPFLSQNIYTVLVFKQFTNTCVYLYIYKYQYIHTYIHTYIHNVR